MLGDQWCGERAAAAVDRVPVPVHPHRVGDGLVGLNEEVLENQSKIAIHRRVPDLLGVDDEPPDHADRLLHRNMCVVEERAFLVHIKLVDKGAARFDHVLRQS